MIDIARYLKYGDSNDFEYGAPIETEHREWKYAKLKFKEMFNNALQSYRGHDLSFCGTFAGCSMLQSLDALPTWSIDVGLDVEGLAKTMNSKHNHGQIDIDNLEYDLITMNSLWGKARCSVEDIYAFSRQKYMVDHGLDNVYCEGGSDWLLMGNKNIYMSVLKYAFYKKEYSITKAASYDPKDIDIHEMMKDEYIKSYMDAFFKNICVFSDEEIKEFGYEPPSTQLREENMGDFTRAAFDWGYQTVYTNRTKVLGDYFGLDIYSPFLNNDQFVKFCLTLPFEMKFCLGRGKHILKESVHLSSETTSKITSKLTPHILSCIKPKMKSILLKYLYYVYRYLPEEIVAKHLDNDYKSWFLLNLGIWLAVHDE